MSFWEINLHTQTVASGPLGLSFAPLARTSSYATGSRSRDASRDPFFGVSVSVSKVSGLVSVSKDFGLGIFVSRLCIGYFLWSFARRSFLKKRFWKMIAQNSAFQRGQWLSFLCCYVICEMEKTIWTLPRLKFKLNSIKMRMCQLNRSA